MVPDCVSEDTTLSTYDVEAKINYRAEGAVAPGCEREYVGYVEKFHEALGQTMTDRCSAGSGRFFKL